MKNLPTILVLEASDANGTLEPRAESTALQSLGRLLNIVVEVQSIDNLQEVDAAAKLFNSYGYCALYFIAHGNEDGLLLPNSECLYWNQIPDLFDFKNSELASLILSSCETLAGDKLISAFENSNSNAPPKNVFGFKQPLDIRDSIPMGCLLLRAMATNNSSEVAAAMASICLALKLDIWAFIRNRETKQYDFKSGAEILSEICDPTKAELGWRDGLLTDRGLVFKKEKDK